MTKDIELIKNFYSSLNRNDVQSVMDLLHPDIERKEFIGTPNAGTFRGLSELRKHITDARSTWIEGSCNPEHFEVSANKVLVSVYVKVKIKESMNWVEGNVSDGFIIQNDKIIFFQTFAEKSQAIDWLNQH